MPAEANDVRYMKKRYLKDEVIRPARDKKRTMRLNHFLANNYAVALIVFLYDLIYFFLLNYIVNSLSKIGIFVQDTSKVNECFGISNILLNLNLVKNYEFARFIYIVLSIILIIMDICLVFQIKTSFSEKNFNVGQKGTSRWTTIEEIKQQYKEIDEKNTRYPGKGGFIVSRMKDKIYIDDSPTNNLIIGMTRSGKGEMEVFPSIDVYSRAEIQSSIIVCDPKIELYKSSKKTLEERGYDVYLLNLDDTLHSMGYNPLALIIELHKQKNYASAELLAQTFSFSIFNPEQSTGDNKFFDDNASSLLSALIIAHITDCLNEDELENEMRYRNYQSKTAAFKELDDDFKDEITKKYYSWVENNKEDPFLSNEIEFIPSEINFYYTSENEKKINMFSIINTFTELARVPVPDTFLTALDLYFSKRPMLDRAKLKYASIEIAGGPKTKGSIYSNMLSKLNVFTYENVGKMTAESSIDLKDIGFGKKPVAVFIAIPDYDKSNHFLATVFIRQTYYVLAKACGESSKCKRPVKFICDEFGNLPPIESMENIITVCLGRNISFDLYIQAYPQLNKLYGDNADTIIGNCGNKMYILTNDPKTAKDFSESIGNETITDLQRSGTKLGLHKTFMESNAERPLLNANQLMELQEGYCVVKRVMKRKDLKGNPVTPTPIYNCDAFGTRFKFRYEYLTDSFPNADTILLSQFNQENREHIKLEERVWNYELTFAHFTELEPKNDENNECIESITVIRFKDLNEKRKKTILDAFKKLFSEEDPFILNLNDMPISKIVDFISNNSFIKEYEKKALLNVITYEEE